MRAQLQSLTDFKRACAGQPSNSESHPATALWNGSWVPKMGKLATEAPSARFSFHDMRTANVVRELKGTQHGLGILRKSAVVTPLKFHSIGQVGYALFAPVAWAKEKENATTLLSQRPVAVPAGGEFDERFQECCEKVKLTQIFDSAVPVSPRSRNWCAVAMPWRYYRKWPSPSPGIGRETIGVRTYARLPPRNRYRLASAARFHPAASGLGFGRA